jgi:hypothetical protein
VGLDDGSPYPEPVRYRHGDIYAPSFDRHEPLAEQADPRGVPIVVAVEDLARAQAGLDALPFQVQQCEQRVAMRCRVWRDDPQLISSH